MNILKAIAKLEEIKNYMGDVDVVIDTEAATFTCHMVEVEDISDNRDIVNVGETPLCIIMPNRKSMRHIKT